MKKKTEETTLHRGLKIVEHFPTAEFYIDDKKIEGVVGYRIKRKLGDLPLVTLKIKPIYCDMDLSSSIVKSRKALFSQLAFQAEHNKKYQELKERISGNAKRIKRLLELL